MATFLELVNRVGSDSGTLGESALSTVVGLTGRPAKIARWTNEAYRAIQNAHRHWRWMRGELTGSTTIDVQRYEGSTFTDADTSTLIGTRFAEFIYTGDGNEDRFSLYDPSIGLSSKGRIRFIKWDRFYRECVNTAEPSGKPTAFSIDPKGRLCLSPKPDAAYTIFAPYRKSAQSLTTNSDVPEMPIDYHDVIVQVAVQFLETHDEAPTSKFQLEELRKSKAFWRLEQEQLPQFRFEGPLA